MSTRKGKFYPGWKMTPDQKDKYWQLIGKCARATGATSAAEREALRKTIHIRAYGAPISVKEIDHLKMFDDFIAVCLAILKPGDLDAQLRVANMEKTRLIFRINQLAPWAYWSAEAHRKFGTNDLMSLSVANLTMFRNHLAARSGEIQWPAPSGKFDNSACSCNQAPFIPKPEAVTVDENKPF